MNHGVNLPLATLLSRYDALKITAVPAPLPRMPFHAGWLPSGLSVTSLDAQRGPAGSTYRNVQLASGSSSVTINLYARTGVVTATVHGPTTTDPSASRSVDGFRVTVTGHRYSRATAQKSSTTWTSASCAPRTPAGGPSPQPSTAEGQIGLRAPAVTVLVVSQ